MASINYVTNMAMPKEHAWLFVQDINNWAPLTKGYQSHEVINDRESIWTVKGEIGPFCRVTKFHVTVTEWVDGERVGFMVKGLNEPITGDGSISLRDDGGGTEISGEGHIHFRGVLAPMVDRLFAPWVRSAADELVTKIVAAVQESSSVQASGEA